HAAVLEPQPPDGILDPHPAHDPQRHAQTSDGPGGVEGQQIGGQTHEAASVLSGRFSRARTMRTPFQTTNPAKMSEPTTTAQSSCVAARQRNRLATPG